MQVTARWLGPRGVGHDGPPRRGVTHHLTTGAGAEAARRRSLGDVADVELSDSWARLDWVRTLVARASALAEPVQAQERPDRLVVRTEQIDGSSVWRYTIRHPHIPSELGFLVADIAVNARSCLDMAMQRLADQHCPTWSRPQFPILDHLDDEGNPATGDTHYRSAKRLLPTALLAVVDSAQPRYDTGDLPRNVSALLIRDLSNVNKHRNLTPVIRAQSSRGFEHPNVPGGDQLRMLATEENPWADDEETVMCVVPPPGMEPDVALQLRPMVSFVTQVDAGPGEGIRLRGDPSFRAGFRLQDVLTRVPRFVRLTLTNLSRAEDFVLRGEPDLPFFDVDLTL